MQAVSSATTSTSSTTTLTTSTTSTTGSSTGAGEQKIATSLPPGAAAAPGLHSRRVSNGRAALSQRVNAPHGKDRTLTQAIEQRDANLVRQLLREQASSSTTANYDAAHLAAAAGHADALLILKAAGDDMHTSTSAGDTPLMLAARHGHANAVRFLAKSADLYHANEFDDSALTLAAAAGHGAIVQRLLVKGANVNHVTGTLNTALIVASRAGHIDVVMILLASRACVGMMNLYRETALMLAEANGHATVVALLKAKGASDTLSPASMALRRDLDQLKLVHDRLPDSMLHGLTRFDFGDEMVQTAFGGATSLMINSRLNDTDVLELLLRHGADLERVDNDGNTALTSETCCCMNLSTVRFLLDAGANVQHRGRWGFNALHRAAATNSLYPEVIFLLLKHGLDINSATAGDHTALDLAANSGNIRAIKFLLWRGASMAANNNGDTALIHAARQGHTNVVNFLLNAGADPAHVNAAGDNALDCAKREKRKGVVALLQGMGVKRAKQ